MRLNPLIVTTNTGFRVSPSPPFDSQSITTHPFSPSLSTVFSHSRDTSDSPLRVAGIEDDLIGDTLAGSQDKDKSSATRSLRGYAPRLPGEKTSIPYGVQSP